MELDRQTGELRVYRPQEGRGDGRRIPSSRSASPRPRRSTPEAELDDELEIRRLPPQEFGRIAAQTRQAGHPPARARRRARADLLGVRRQGRADHPRRGAPHREAQRHPGDRQGRGDPARARADPGGALQPRRSRPRLRPGGAADAPRDRRSCSRGRTRATSSRLFETEIPEIQEGIVEVKAAAREPGERAKVAVASTKRDVDPIGACVGLRGTRIQVISRELRSEKIDIIEWSHGSGDLRGARAVAGQGVVGDHRRGPRERRAALGAGDRAGQPALAGHRQEGTERAPRGQADRACGSTSRASARSRRSAGAMPQALAGTRWPAGAARCRGALVEALAAAGMGSPRAIVEAGVEALPRCRPSRRPRRQVYAAAEAWVAAHAEPEPSDGPAAEVVAADDERPLGACMTRPRSHVSRLSAAPARRASWFDWSGGRTGRWCGWIRHRAAGRGA